MPFKPWHYQHDLDRESLLNLRAMKWFEGLSRYLVAEEIERDFYILNLVDNVRMTARDFPRPIAHLEHACDVLGVEELPTLFLDTGAEPHSQCIGETRPMIVLSSGLLELLDDDELAAAIAHEVAHVACRHAYYKLLAENFSGVAQLTNVIPGLGAAAFAFKLPLYDWYRKADLSADRGAFLVLRDQAPLLHMIGKIAGGSGHIAERLSTESLLEQARETQEATQEMKTGTFKQKAAYFFSNLVMQGMFRTQPWPALRVLEIQEWVGSDNAKDLLAGRLPEEKPPEPEPEPEAGNTEEDAGFFKTWSDAVGGMGKSLKFWGGGGENENENENDQTAKREDGETER